MIFTSESTLPIKDPNKTYVFLAGSISSKPNNWRLNIVKTFKNYIFFDPTHINFSTLNSKEMDNQVQWELDAMRLADLVILNFLPNALSPISLVELGLNVATKKMVVICPDEFYKSSYVKKLCDYYNVKLYNTIDEVQI